MIGAIIGDIAGSKYEFNNTFDYNFPMFGKGHDFTDDTICTIAVADAILKKIPFKDSFLYWCKKYPHPMGCYGASFDMWLHTPNPQPYNSFGNGAAMRVSPVGWACKHLSQVLMFASEQAACSHSHIEGIKGAQVIAALIYMYKKKETPVAIDGLMVSAYGAEWYRQIPEKGEWDDTCQGCVPLAYLIVKKATSFEDAIRRAVSYGGDSDTLGAIVGSIAEARFGVPRKMEKIALSYLPEDMKEVYQQFKAKYNGKRT